MAATRWVASAAMVAAMCHPGVPNPMPFPTHPTAPVFSICAQRLHAWAPMFTTMRQVHANLPSRCHCRREHGYGEDRKAAAQSRLLVVIRPCTACA